MTPSQSEPAQSLSGGGIQAANAIPAPATLTWPVIVYMLTVAAPIVVQLGPLQLSLMRMFLLLAIVPLMANLLMGRYGRVYVMDYLFIGHIFWMTVSLAVNNPNAVVEATGSAAVQFLGGYVVGRAYIRSPGAFIGMIKVIVAITLVTLPLALIEAKTGKSPVIELFRAMPGINTYGNVNNPPRLGLERSQTLFPHPILYGLYASIGVGLVLHGLRSQMALGKRIWLCIGLFACVLLSLSSGALLPVLMQVMLFGWYGIMRSKKSPWLILFGIFVTLYVGIDVLSDRTPSRVFMSYATFSPHNAFYRDAINDWGLMNVMGSAENGIPSARLFGIGLNTWIRPAWMFTGSVDNFWLVMALRHGLPGLGFLAAGYAMILWRVGRSDLSGADPLLQDLRRAWVVVFIGLTFTLITVHIWGTVYSFVFFFLASGVWFIGAGGTVSETASEDALEDLPDPSRTAYTRFPAGRPETASARTIPAAPVRTRATSARVAR